MARCWWKLDLKWSKRMRSMRPRACQGSRDGDTLSLDPPLVGGVERTETRPAGKLRWLKGSAMNPLSNDNRQGSRRRVADRRSVAPFRSGHERRVMRRREIYLPVEAGRRFLAERRTSVENSLLCKSSSIIVCIIAFNNNTSVPGRNCRKCDACNLKSEA